MANIESFLEERFENAILMDINGDPTKHPGKILLINVDGFSTRREDRTKFIDYNYIFYYEPEMRISRVLAGAILPPSEGEEYISLPEIFYFPKNEQVDRHFSERCADITITKFDSPEALIVSYYFQKATKTYNTYLFLQLICAYPNIDFRSICENLGLQTDVYLDTEPYKKLYESSQRQDQMRGVIQLIDFVERFPVDISQKFEKYKSLGVVGINDFSRTIIEYLSPKMYVDVYDKDYSIEEIRKLCPDATGNMNFLLKKCNALLICKNVGLRDEHIADKMVFDVSDSFENQSQKIKIAGCKGWVVW